MSLGAEPEKVTLKLCWGLDAEPPAAGAGPRRVLSLAITGSSSKRTHGLWAQRPAPGSFPPVKDPPPPPTLRLSAPGTPPHPLTWARTTSLLQPFAPAASGSAPPCTLPRDVSRTSSAPTTAFFDPTCRQGRIPDPQRAPLAAPPRAIGHSLLPSPPGRPPVVTEATTCLLGPPPPGDAFQAPSLFEIIVESL